MNASGKKKLAWITGASTGIGASTAIALAQDGWDVVMTARSKDKLEQMAKLSSEFKGRLIPLQGDVTHKDGMKQAVDQHHLDVELGQPNDQIGNREPAISARRVQAIDSSPDHVLEHQHLVGAHRLEDAGPLDAGDLNAERRAVRESLGRAHRRPRRIDSELAE